MSPLCTCGVLSASPASVPRGSSSSAPSVQSSTMRWPNRSMPRSSLLMRKSSKMKPRAAAILKIRLASCFKRSLFRATERCRGLAAFGQSGGKLCPSCVVPCEPPLIFIFYHFCKNPFVVDNIINFVVHLPIKKFLVFAVVLLDPLSSCNLLGSSSSSSSSRARFLLPDPPKSRHLYWGRHQP